jgi:hypothetical protein
VSRPDDGTFFAERMTVRPSLLAPGARKPARALKVVHRGDPAVDVSHEGMVETRGRLAPLRGWYPLEVLHFPVGNSGDEDVTLAEEEVARGLADGSLVVDTRLRDALRRSGSSGLRAPVEGSGGLTLPVPDVVEDAAYAVECAALGEADVPRLEERLDELENRLASLERGVWPRVVRRLTRRPS